MITEVMTLLIAVGAVMIFVVWNQGKKRQQKIEERREVEETTGKLKQELEKTANEVIGRMESQVSSLEDLLDESEKNRTVLEGRVAELKKLLKRSEGQSTEIRDLLTKLEEAGDTVEELQRKLEIAEKKISMSMQMPMQMPMQPTMMPMSSMSPMAPMATSMMNPMMTQPLMTTPLPNVPSPISPPPILSSRQTTAAPLNVTPKPVSTSNTTPSTEPAKVEAAKVEVAAEKPKPKKMDKAEMKKALEKASSEAEKAEPKDFAKVLEKSMENTESQAKSEVRVPSVPGRRSIVVSSNSNQRAATTIVNSDQPVKIENKRTEAAPQATSERRALSRDNDKNAVNNSAKIKDMLLEGMSVEDIARETGLGRGAVELVQEMTRRKLERR